MGWTGGRAHWEDKTPRELTGTEFWKFSNQRHWGTHDGASYGRLFLRDELFYFFSKNYFQTVGLFLASNAAERMAGANKTAPTIATSDSKNI